MKQTRIPTSPLPLLENFKFQSPVYNCPEVVPYGLIGLGGEYVTLDLKNKDIFSPFF
jgi:hypothetical protein